MPVEWPPAKLKHFAPGDSGKNHGGAGNKKAKQKAAGRRQQDASRKKNRR